MSVSSATTRLEQAERELARGKDAVAAQSRRVGVLSADLANLQARALRATSAASLRGIAGSIRSKDADLGRAQARLSDLLKAQATANKRLGDSQEALGKAEAAEIRSQARSRPALGRARRPFPAATLFGSGGPVAARDIGPPSPATVPVRRGPGRPRGPYLIESPRLITDAIEELRQRNGRRPLWTEVAGSLGVDERTLRKARRAHGLD